ncbi:hypothetical protein ACFVS2_21770 [Brevibacillus sp. NPDC058079]|uniref:BC1872 family protein n=1 Tax=Brevibacillus sp. NPDC058079 TaxID=3346330 RepID=UPI0036DFB94A
MKNDRIDCPDCEGVRFTDMDEGGAYCSTCGERAPMTEQQIIKVLATEVMGWEFIHVDYTGTDEETTRQKELTKWMDRVNLFDVGDYFIDVENHFWKASSDWNPLKNIADAWMVVEKLFIAVVPQSPNSPEDMRFLAYVDNDPLSPKIEVFAGTAQIAICQVALRMVA